MITSIVRSEYPDGSGWYVEFTGPTADGEIRVRSEWQRIYAGWDEREDAGSAETLRTTWLNGCPVKDPEYAQRLLAEILATDDG
jgi:hypothetical protein